MRSGLMDRWIGGFMRSFDPQPTGPDFAFVSIRMASPLIHLSINPIIQSDWPC